MFLQLVAFSLQTGWVWLASCDKKDAPIPLSMTKLFNPLLKAQALKHVSPLDCKTVVFFANASNAVNIRTKGLKRACEACALHTRG